MVILTDNEALNKIVDQNKKIIKLLQGQYLLNDPLEMESIFSISKEKE
jgi:hypothetical protein